MSEPSHIDESWRREIRFLTDLHLNSITVDVPGLPLRYPGLP